VPRQDIRLLKPRSLLVWPRRSVEILARLSIGIIWQAVSIAHEIKAYGGYFDIQNIGEDRNYDRAFERKSEYRISTVACLFD